MQILERRLESSDIISLEGDLDASTTAEVRAELRRRLRGGKTRFILDISKVDFIDSSGLSVLVTALKSAREMGGDIALLNPTAQAKALIELTRLHRIFEIYEDEDDAVAAFQE